MTVYYLSNINKIIEKKRRREENVNISLKRVYNVSQVAFNIKNESNN